MEECRRGYESLLFFRRTQTWWIGCISGSWRRWVMLSRESLVLTISRQTPVIMVNQPSGEGDISIRHILPNWVRASPFLPYGRGAMHIKASNHLAFHCIKATHIALVYACRYRHCISR